MNAEKLIQKKNMNTERFMITGNVKNNFESDKNVYNNVIQEINTLIKFNFII